MAKKLKRYSKKDEEDILNKEETWDNFTESSKKRYINLLKKLDENDISVMNFLAMSREKYNVLTNSNVKTDASFKIYQSKLRTVYKSEIRQKQIEIKFKDEFKVQNVNPNDKIDKIKSLHNTIHKLEFTETSRNQSKYVACVNDLINRFNITRDEGKELMDYYIKTPKKQLKEDEYTFLKDFYY